MFRKAFLLAAAVLLIVAASVSAKSTLTLGSKRANNGDPGYGSVRPKEISNRGDPDSYVQNIHWRTWGGARATGIGTAGFTWPGFAVADGTRYVTAKVVAFDPGKCGKTRAYRQLEWYFTEYGQRFSTYFSHTNICTGKPLPYNAAREDPVDCPGGQYLNWVSGGLRCRDLAGIKRTVKASSHRGHTAKWRSSGGWLCGTDLAAG
ncbi:MAG: hypothetical protein J2O48_10915, partial [Solirubrobacterales bacterium]|nr:hypothetical protein [Solirubrobacterales bacterium]